MALVVVAICIFLLVLLISKVKLNTFLSFLIVSILAGLLLGIPADAIAASVQKGIGDMLGGLVIIIVTGAMLGKLVAESGAAQTITNAMMKIFGEKYIHWAMMITGFIIGIPLFYSVGFVLVVPFIFSVSHRYKIPTVFLGVSMLAALSVTHGFLPPHPSPTVLVTQFNASMGTTLLYGVIIAVPTVIIAGPVFASTLKNIRSVPLLSFQPALLPEQKLPGLVNSLVSSLLPVILLASTTIATTVAAHYGPIPQWLIFLGDAPVVLLMSLLVATVTLGSANGIGMKRIGDVYGDAVKDVAMLLLIIAGAGAFKQVLVDSHVNAGIVRALNMLSIHPLILGWLTAAIIRVCLGSATVAGLTAAALILPVMVENHTNPNLMVLSIGAGSLMFSHVNDTGFWLFKEYFNLSIRDTLRSWSLMETIIACAGLIGVLLLNSIL